MWPIWYVKVFGIENTFEFLICNVREYEELFFNKGRGVIFFYEERSKNIKLDPRLDKC